LAITATLLLVVGFVGAAVFRGRTTRPASVNDAVERFRTDGGATSTGAAGRPAPGVYTYSGSGSEKLSFLAGDKPMGPKLPATVTYDGDDCWTFRIEFNDTHWQSWDSCVHDGTVTNPSGDVFQRYDFVVADYTTSVHFECDAPADVVRVGMQPGDAWNRTCRFSSATVGESVGTGPLTYTGLESLSIGGSQVATYHIRESRTQSGSQSGTAIYDTWYSTDTALPVKARWHMQTDSESPVGKVTYTEQGEWLLDDLSPRT